MGRRPDIGGTFLGKYIDEKLYIQTPSHLGGVERKSVPCWCPLKEKGVL
jgi:hypothetical protein